LRFQSGNAAAFDTINCPSIKRFRAYDLGNERISYVGSLIRVDEKTMRTTKILIAALVLGTTSLANAEEFDMQDAMSLAQGKRVETDCSINWKNPKDDKVYCFANARNQFMFKQNAKTFVPRAQKTFEAD
jgi:hypothetical protein